MRQPATCPHKSRVLPLGVGLSWSGTFSRYQHFWWRFLPYPKRNIVLFLNYVYTCSDLPLPTLPLANPFPCLPIAELSQPEYMVRLLKWLQHVATTTPQSILIPKRSPVDDFHRHYPPKLQDHVAHQFLLGLVQLNLQLLRLLHQLGDFLFSFVRAHLTRLILKDALWPESCG